AADDTGDMTHPWAYPPYGTITGHTGSHTTPYTWLGTWGVRQEGDTGLYHMGRRVYDSATMRVISREPVLNTAHPLTFNPYQYARNNPMRFVAPTGEDAEPGFFSSGGTGSDIVSNTSTVNSGLGWVLDHDTPKAVINAANAYTNNLGDIQKLDPGHQVDRT